MQLRKRLVLSIDYDGSNNLLFANTTKIYQFKPKESEIKECTLCLGNISKDFTINNMKKQNWKEVQFVFLLILFQLKLALF